MRHTNIWAVAVACPLFLLSVIPAAALGPPSPGGDLPAMQASDDKPGESGSPGMPSSDPGREVAAEIDPPQPESTAAADDKDPPVAAVEAGEGLSQEPDLADLDRPVPASVTGQSGEIAGDRPPTFSDSEITVLVVGGLLGCIVLILVVRALARRTTDRYGWPMILNWWNALYAVGLLGGMALLSVSPMAAGALVALCWGIMLVVNILKTDLLTGVAITVLQPFIVLTVVALVAVVTARPKPYSRPA